MKNLVVPFLLVFAVSFASCASLPKPVAAAGSAFVACVKGDAPSVGAALLGQVESIIASGAAGWEGALEQLGIAFGEDAVACAVEAAQAGFAAMSSGGSGASTSDSPDAAAYAAAAARAQAYLNSHPL